MNTRIATGTRFKDAEERRARNSHVLAKYWKLVKAAVQVVDSSRQVSRGVYEIPPEAMLALRHHCDDMRFSLKMHELEVAKEGENDE